MRLRLSPSLMRRIDHKLDLELSGATIGECLHYGSRKYPELAELVWDGQKTINPGLLLFHNNDHIKQHDLDRAVQVNDVLDLVPAIEGG